MVLINVGSYHYVTSLTQELMTVYVINKGLAGSRCDRYHQWNLEPSALKQLRKWAKASHHFINRIEILED